MLAGVIRQTVIRNRAVAVRAFGVSARLLKQTETRLYTKDHEWLETHDDGTATIGITQYAQEKLGDIVFVQLPEIGSMLKRGAECGTIESVKAASEIYAPCTGLVSHSNKKLEKEPALINKDPYKKGWLYKVKVSDANELKELLDEAGYKKLVDGQSTDAA